MDIQKTPTTLPKSASNYWVNLFALVFFFVPLFFLHRLFPQLNTVFLTAVSLPAILIPLWIFDFLYLRVDQRASSGLLVNPGKPDIERLVIKLIALFGTLSVILFDYFVIYTCFNATYLKTFFEFLVLSYPLIILGCFVYVWQVDRRQKDPYDEYWHIGSFLTGRSKKINGIIFREYIAAWFIRGFFIPYVFVILVRYVEAMFTFDWSKISFFMFYDHLLDLFYTIDIIYFALGYVLTWRLLDAHIRSTEPTFLGWLVCLVCYGPFYNYFGIGLLQYEDGFQWNHWFAFQPFFYYFYGITIIFLSLVYCLATVAMGYRASNLTYRGIITSGPYRYTKHPAYLCKVASWWLITLPFLSVDGPWVAFKKTLALSFITFIYYLRARTEENHLSNYPEYVEYAKWINEHGLFRSITKRFKYLQYSEEKCKKWGSLVWFKKMPSV